MTINTMGSHNVVDGLGIDGDVATRHVPCGNHNTRNDGFTMRSIPKISMSTPPMRSES